MKAEAYDWVGDLLIYLAETYGLEVYDPHVTIFIDMPSKRPPHPTWAWPVDDEHRKMVPVSFRAPCYHVGSAWMQRHFPRAFAAFMAEYITSNGRTPYSNWHGHVGVGGRTYQRDLEKRQGIHYFQP